MSETTMPAISTTEKAGWWTRVLAILIDAIGIGIIAGAVSSILGSNPTSTQSQGLSTLFQAVYSTHLSSAAGKGQTLGTRAPNIRVVQTDGSYLDYFRAFLPHRRFIASCLWFFTRFIGAAFD